MLYASLIVVGYVAFCWLCWYRYRCQHQPAAVESEADLVIAYASQSGRAAELAANTARQLQGSQVQAQVLPIDKLNDQKLQQSTRILFIVSTYGEGDPPDMAARFAHRQLRTGANNLSHLRYAVLALGDRQYSHFCRFGHQLCQGLQRQAAQPLFDLIEVDQQDPSALALWQQRLAKIGGSGSTPADLRPACVDAILHHRQCLNRGSSGAPVFRLQLKSDPSLVWQAGDIACVAAGNDPEQLTQFLQEFGLDGSLPADAGDGSASEITLQQTLTYRRLPSPGLEREGLLGLSPAQLLKRLPPLPTRDYSIASIPADGHIELLVRQMRYPNGCLGLGSGWLTSSAEMQSPLRLQLRSNPMFHSPAPETPLILIGNGTGIAGLRAHLRARLEQGAHRNWLLFGERHAAHDLHYQEELNEWHRSGHLQRLDLAFSRDDGERRYVQDLLPSAVAELVRWVSDGAAIYVCGSRAGMAAGVEQALVSLLGSASVDQLKETGRYQRDVY